MIAREKSPLLVMLVTFLAMQSAICCINVDQQEQQLQAVTHSAQSSLSGRIRLLLDKRLVRFNDFKRKFYKQYKTEGEDSRRHLLFSGRLLRVYVTIVKYFNKQSGTYNSINSRSDMTKREREQLRAGLPKSVATQGLKANEIYTELESPVHRRFTRAIARASSLPDSKALDVLSSRWFPRLNFVKPAQQNYVTIDLRSTDCFFPPGDQGQCNSCASFMAISQLEFLRCRETGAREKFSEQFPIDCGGPFGMMGCGGTDVHSLNKFISQVGLVSGVTYPYVGRQQRCPLYSSLTRRYNFMRADTLRLKSQGLSGARSSYWSRLLARSIPLHVGVWINDDFEDYGGGVASSCIGSNGVHAMLLIGEGRENGADYWLMRNSFGTWGLDGHFKINKKAHSCLADQGMGYYPVVFTNSSGFSFVGSLGNQSAFTRA